MNKKQYIEYYKIVKNKYEREKSLLINNYLKEYNTFKFFKIWMSINEQKYEEAKNELDKNYKWKRDSNFLNISCLISHWSL